VPSVQGRRLAEAGIGFGAAAMDAGITDRVWTLGELINA